MRSGRVELAGAGAGQPAHIAGKLYARGLHAQADAEVGHAILARVADGVEHAFNASLAKATRHQDAVKTGQLLLVLPVSSMLALQAFGFDPGHTQLEIERQ